MKKFLFAISTLFIATSCTVEESDFCIYECNDVSRKLSTYYKNIDNLSSQLENKQIDQDQYESLYNTYREGIEYIFENACDTCGLVIEK